MASPRRRWIDHRRDNLDDISPNHGRGRGRDWHRHVERGQGARRTPRRRDSHSPHESSHLRALVSRTGETVFRLCVDEYPSVSSVDEGKTARNPPAPELPGPGRRLRIAESRVSRRTQRPLPVLRRMRNARAAGTALHAVSRFRARSGNSGRRSACIRRLQNASASIAMTESAPAVSVASSEEVLGSRRRTKNLAVASFAL